MYIRTYTQMYCVNDIVYRLVSIVDIHFATKCRLVYSRFIPICTEYNWVYFALVGYYLVFVSRRFVRGGKKAFSEGETPTRCFETTARFFSTKTESVFKRRWTCEPFHLNVLHVSHVLSLLARGVILYFPKEFRSYIWRTHTKKKVSSNTRITPRFHKKKVGHKEKDRSHPKQQEK